MCLTLRSSYLERTVTIFSFKPPPPTPQKVLEKNKPPGGLNRGFTVKARFFFAFNYHLKYKSFG